MSRIKGWLKGDVVVSFRCGIKVIRTDEQWGYGDVYYVYCKRYYHDGTFEWRRDTRMFTREQAIDEASRRVMSEEAWGARDPKYRKLWQTATEKV